MVAVHAKYLGEAGGVGVHHGPTVAEGLQQGVDGIQPEENKEKHASNPFPVCVINKRWGTNICKKRPNKRK